MKHTISLGLCFCLLLLFGVMQAAHAETGQTDAETYYTLPTIEFSELPADVDPGTEMSAAADAIQAAYPETPQPARPGKPQSIRVTPGNMSLDIAWVPATAPEGDKVIKYVLSINQDEQRAVIAANDTLSYTFENLFNDVEYVISIYASTLSGHTSEIVSLTAMPSLATDGVNVLVAEPTPMPDGDVAILISSRETADIRKGPGLSYPVIDTVLVGGQVFLQEWHGEFARILYNDASQAGWIHSKNIQLQ